MTYREIINEYLKIIEISENIDSINYNMLEVINYLTQLRGERMEHIVNKAIERKI